MTISFVVEIEGRRTVAIFVLSMVSLKVAMKLQKVRIVTYEQRKGLFEVGDLIFGERICLEPCQFVARLDNSVALVYCSVG